MGGCSIKAGLSVYVWVNTLGSCKALHAGCLIALQGAERLLWGVMVAGHTQRPLPT